MLADRQTNRQTRTIITNTMCTEYNLCRIVMRNLLIGNESVLIQLAQCRFPRLAISLFVIHQ